MDAWSPIVALKLNSADIPALLRSGDLNANVTHAAYNALDSAVTLRVHSRLSEVLAAQNTSHAQTSYSFVRAMQAPALDMMRRGIAVNSKVRQDETARFSALRDRAQALLDTLADAIWGPEHYVERVRVREMWTPVGKRGQPLQPRLRTVIHEEPRTRQRGLNAGSNPQCLAFFNTALNFPVEYEIRKTPEGRTRTPTANDKALRKWAKARVKGPGVDPRDRAHPPLHLAQPFVSLILSIRDADKMLGVLKTPLDPDGRMRCSYNVVGTESGRWSSSKNAFGRGCVLAGTEVLTPKGWQTIETIQNGDTVLQWDKGATMWAQAEPFTTDYRGTLFKVEGEQIHQELTANHRVPHWNSRGTFYVDPAFAVAGKSQINIPLASPFYGGSEHMPRWWAMLMADWSWTGRGWQAAFRKERKVERFLALAQEFNIEFTEQNSARDGYRRFYIPGYTECPLNWGPWVFNVEQSDLSDLVEEARHWDAHDRGSGFIFYSARESVAEWFAIAAQLAGRGTTTRITEQNEGSYSDSTMWSVNVKKRNFAQVMRKHWSTREFEGPVYCLTVPSSFFVIRSKGKISITGNTNLQNITPTMRRMFAADDGYHMVSTDLEQAESRVVGGLVWATTGDDTYLNACSSADLHTTVCTMAWPERPWTNDLKHNRALAEERYPALTQYTYRDVAKRIGHGSNYHGSPFGIAQAVGIPSYIVEEFQHRYFRAFPAIPQWHNHIKTELQSNQFLDTPLSRRRYFFSRPTEDTTLREAIAFIPQSTVAELLNLIMYKCWARSILPRTDPLHLPIQLLLQNHDAFAFQTPTSEDLPRIIEQVNLEFTTTSIPLSRGAQHLALTIPGEFVTGFNWAYADKDPTSSTRAFADGNPDGLRKWSGSDHRKRQQGAAPQLGDWLNRPLARVF